MVIIDRVINNLLGGLTLDPAGMHCPSWNDAFVSSLLYAAEIFDIIASFGLSGHTYADYSQLRAGIRIANSCSPVGYMCQKSRSMDGVQQTEIKRPLRLS